jgi:hypothetical protein
MTTRYQLVGAFAAFKRLDFVEIAPGRRRVGRRTSAACCSALSSTSPWTRHRYSRSTLARRVHQPIGELAVSREQQQAGCVEIETADNDPAHRP